MVCLSSPNNRYVHNTPLGVRRATAAAETPISGRDDDLRDHRRAQPQAGVTGDHRGRVYRRKPLSSVAVAVGWDSPDTETTSGISHGFFFARFVTHVVMYYDTEGTIDQEEIETESEPRTDRTSRDRETGTRRRRAER